ncbi:hypothetical protein [Halalkalibacter okhensis]|uniref:Uncharacterized protein n=1 Tax=Halalkalibacter okhensis TaxID=333138 RepID=A0A0B0IKD6_9BACI|nr:hypothetical protein [Halalkalibacter okhensis]KHF40514.1 hypothetical protein LQ50_09660 [Halalkalibacter okhensis]
MALYFGALSVFISVLVAVIAGLPLNLTVGFKFPYEGYFVVGFTSTFFYYLYIFKYLKSSFSYYKLLNGIPLAAISFATIMFIQYNIAYITKDGFIHNLPIGDTLKSQVTFLNYLLFPQEGIFFFLGSLLPMFILTSRRIICYQCKKSFMEERLLFNSSIDDYLKDVQQVQAHFYKDEINEFAEFIKEKRMLTKFNTKKRNLPDYTFYHLICNPCNSQYIASKKHNDIGEQPTEEKAYKIVARKALSD